MLRTQAARHTCGHFPLDCALLLITSTVFLRESWSIRDTNTGRMYFIRAEREGGGACVAVLLTAPGER